MTTFTQERRKHVRLKKNVPVKISSDEFDVVTETKNLSCAGAYCRVNKYIDPMTKLNLQLLVPLKRNKRVITRKISCQGVIVRIESHPDNDHYNAAIYFNEIHQKDAKFIEKYVNTALLTQENIQ